MKQGVAWIMVLGLGGCTEVSADQGPQVQEALVGDDAIAEPGISGDVVNIETAGDAVPTNDVLPTPRKGMTWAKVSHQSATGTDLVSCHDGGTSCNAYQGDTDCTFALPMLCFKPDASENPGVEADFYHGWKGGHVAITPPVRGDQLMSLETADHLCAMNFGAGWRMADFHHDAGGWAWHAYGDVRDDSRFWVAIYDQAANCWD